MTRRTLFGQARSAGLAKPGPAPHLSHVWVGVIRGHQVLRREGEGPPWVLLHGFTGSPKSFDPLLPRLPRRVATLAIALPGHAHLPQAHPALGFEAAVHNLATVLAPLGPVPILGYSLGARLAFGLTCLYPQRVQRLVAIGGHPGLQGADLRAARAEQDAELARALNAHGVAAFIRRWQALPLFESQGNLPNFVQKAQQRIRQGHRADALAHALTQLSLARMPDWRPGLAHFRGPIDLMVGAQDDKFRGLNQALAGTLTDGHLHVVPGVGHNVLLEAPAQVARLMTTGDPHRSRVRPSRPRPG